ncbi:glycoside hydrolase family 73 protein [Burkholderia ubonensis]|uniref:glycoside hydrolase family 73 protein n=1 Tax=Burkholderia ubonensis TaxID=101571 RepID=UPI00075E13C9|nr:glucosaminidase domain-containing protein [Burkholderia ubonensis]KVC98355.1 calcium-binding protein [Burkholderia ubonensis]KVW61982.1 calcium-binding protein [Burkholderia ubonensis]
MTNKHPSQQPPKQPASGPKPAKPAPARDQPAYTPLAWSFPFSPAGKEDAADPMTYMKALASAEDGFYPLGASGNWHGGIHFDQKTGKVLKQDEGVRAIAKGEVVAYRLDSKYPELAYQDKRFALYSTGFVLVRHILQLPPVPKKPDPAPSKAAPASQQPVAPNGASAPSGASGTAATQAAPASPPPDEKLTFFSLYMHTLDWASYKAALDHAGTAKSDPKAPQLKPMRYWEADRYYRVGDKDKQEAPKPKPIDHDVLGDLINADFDMSKLSPEQREADEAPPDPIPGIRVRVTPNGKILGLLPKGSELTVDESDNGGAPGWAKIGKIKSGQPVGAIAGQPPSEHLPWGYVYVKELEPVSQSGPVDTVVVLKKPYPVEAGEVIAHIGQYQRYREAKPTPPQPNRSMLHLEVFAGSDLPKFIKKSQARARDLPDNDKAFLEILAGAKLVTEIPRPDYTLEKAGLKLAPISDPKSHWVKVQPKTVTMPAAQPTPPDATGKGKSKPKPTKKPTPIETSTGDPFWVDSGLVNQMTTGPVQGWKEFPLKVSRANGPGTDFRDVFRLTDLDKFGVQNFAREEKDASGKAKRWWKVTVGTKDGGTRQGWVREKDHPQVNLCSPWDWPGFDLADNSAIKPVDMFKRYLFVAGLAMGDDQQAFKPSADQLATSELIQKLEKAIDRNHDGNVTAEELIAAQQTEWLAKAVSHLIVKSESEWGGNMGKWEEILPHMKLVPWKWQNEMERIKKLQWWEQIKGVQGFPQDPVPWHLHPIGLVGNFLVKRSVAGTAAFPADVIEAAQAAQAKWGIPASISLAQWGLESAMGKRMPKNSYNPFGIKATKSDIENGRYVDAMTSEVFSGKEVRLSQPFRKFENFTEAFDFHGKLLATGRAYAGARAKLPDPYEFARALTGHYATDPIYDKKLIDKFIKPYNLTQYDTP